MLFGSTKRTLSNYVNGRNKDNNLMYSMRHNIYAYTQTFCFSSRFSLPNYLGLGAIVKLNVTAPEPWKILAISNYHQIKSTHPNQTNHLNCTLLLYRFSFVGLLPSSGALYIKMCHYWSAGKATFPLSWGGLWTQFLNVAQLWYTEWSPKVGNMFRRRIFC